MDTYNWMMQSGAMAAGGSTVTNVSSEGALAQTLDLTGNRLCDALAVHALRRIVDWLEHPLGPNHTSIVSMTVHGSSIAADDRTCNNQLIPFVPQEILENKMIAETVRNSSMQSSTVYSEVLDPQAAHAKSTASLKMSVTTTPASVGVLGVL